MKKIEMLVENYTEKKTINSIIKEDTAESIIPQFLKKENFQIKQIHLNRNKNKFRAKKLEVTHKNVKETLNSSIFIETSQKIGNPITKRLYSLLNTNDGDKTEIIDSKISKSFKGMISSVENEETPFKTEISPSNYRKYYDDSKLTTNAVFKDHKKLRGFLRQTYVEKCGFPLIENVKEDKNMINIDHENEIKAVFTNIPIKTPKLVINSVISTVNWQPKANYRREMEEENEKNDENQENKNSSNNIIENEPQITFSIASPNEKDSSTTNNSENSFLLNKNRRQKNSIFTLNYIFGKLLRNKEKQKSNNNNIYRKGVKNLSNQEINRRKNDTSEGNSRTYKRVSNNHYNENMFGRRDSMENLSYKDESGSRSKSFFESCSIEIPIHTDDRGDEYEKTKLNFTKKLFRIFSHSRPVCESKKSKIISMCIISLTGVTLNNLINLITILSVELVMTIIKSNEKVQKSSASTLDLKYKPPETNSISGITSNDETVRNSCLSRFALNQKLRNSLSNKPVLSFDLNGRLITGEDSLRPNRTQMNLNHNSWTNLHTSRLQSSMINTDSSSLSTQSRYNRDGINSKIAFNSRVREPFNNKLLNLSKTRTCHNISHGNHDPICNGNMSKYKSNFAGFPYEKSNFSLRKIRPEISENGKYKIDLPIISALNFTKLNGIFLLKDDLFNMCNKSVLFVRENNSDYSNKMARILSKRIKDSWYLQIESLTMEDLIRSIQLTEKRFPEWNLASYIEK